MNRTIIINALTKRGIAFDQQATTSELNLLLRASWLTVRNAADPAFSAGSNYDAEMTIHGQIGEDWYGDGGYSAKQFQDELKPMAGKKVLLNLHSEGGNVWDAFAIAEMIRNHGNVDTKVLGLAASSGDVIFQAGKTRSMPSMAMRMAHNPSGLFIASGNSKELEGSKDRLQQTIDRLNKHANTLATMYSTRSGQSIDAVRACMDKEEFMDGDESLANGYCDRITNEIPVQDRLDLSRFKNTPTEVLNQFNALPPQGERNKQPAHQVPQPQDNKVNKQAKIALLNSWGVQLPAGFTADNIKDEWLDAELAKGKPVTPATPPPAAINTLSVEDRATLDAARAQIASVRANSLRAQLERFAGNDPVHGNRIDANAIENWLPQALAAQDDPKTGNPIINLISALPPKPTIGVAPLGTIDVGDKTTVQDMIRGASREMAPRAALLRNPELVRDAHVRNDLAKGSKAVAKMIKKQVAAITGHITEGRAPVPNGEGGLTVFNKQRAQVISGWLDSMSAVMNDTNNGPYGSVTVSSDLQRQVIFAEGMRAFKRRTLPLSCFAHTYNNVPLQGKDEIDVEYYPLYTTQSQRFISPGAAGAAAGTTGYQFSGTDQTFRKQILVGGSGPNTKVAGQDRAYQALTYSAYLQRRQPWTDLQKLVVMRAEQLGLDVLSDILLAWVLKANFGISVWGGVPTAFDDSAVALLAGVSRKSDWPDHSRNLVIGTDYWVNLVSSPYVKAYLNIGDTGAIREGRVGGLYGFEDTIENPRIPATADGNLVGFITYPSAILVATAPILPGPGEMKNMVSYDLATDPDDEGGGGLTFEYKYWGEPWNSADREIIECNYGSGLGEIAALKRITSNAAGN